MGNGTSSGAIMMHFRQYANGTIVDEDDFEEYDNSIPFYDDYACIDITDEIYDHMATVLSTDALYEWIATQ